MYIPDESHYSDISKLGFTNEKKIVSFRLW